MDKDERLISLNTKDKSYDIMIGRSVLPGINRMDHILKAERFTVIVSSNVYRLYREDVDKSFAGYGNF